MPIACLSMHTTPVEKVDRLNKEKGMINLLLEWEISILYDKNNPSSNHVPCNIMDKSTVFKIQVNSIIKYEEESQSILVEKKEGR